MRVDGFKGVQPLRRSTAGRLQIVEFRDLQRSSCIIRADLTVQSRAVQWFEPDGVVGLSLRVSVLTAEVEQQRNRTVLTLFAVVPGGLRSLWIRADVDVVTRMIQQHCE